MPTSAAGSKATHLGPRRRSSGFTLLELLVVVAIIAIASAGVVFSLRDDGATQTEREAQRLAALLEQARALARTQGRVVTWAPTKEGFEFQGLLLPSLPTRWLQTGTRAQISSALVLGPEPLIAPQQVVLTRDEASATRLYIYTDGLQPFRVSSAPPVP